MICRIVVAVTFVWGLLVVTASHGTESDGPRPFQPTWESLKAHQDPAWFRDAKFGIYTHWGPVTVGSEDCPAGGQWYGNEMYSPKSGVFAWHKQRFGDQAKVGYKDLIPKFKAEKFDADAWAELFARSGQSSPVRWPCITTISPCGTPRSRLGTRSRWGRTATSPVSWKRPSSGAV